MSTNRKKPKSRHLFPNNDNILLSESSCSGFLSMVLSNLVKAEKAMANGKIYPLPMGYPAMTPGDGKVYGYLLSFADSRLLKVLDDLEDYQPNQLEAKNLYNRYYIEIYELKGLSLGWAYFMRP